MIDYSGLLERWRALWRWLRAPVWLGLGFALGFGVPYGVYLDRLVRERFAELSFAQPSRVYARPLRLAPRVGLSLDMLKLELSAARYRDASPVLQPGTFHATGAKFEIMTRAFVGAHGAQAQRHLTLRISDARVAGLTDANTGKPVSEAWLDPARIATLYGPNQVERRFVRLADVPPLLVATLQAVEDRDFKHHHGIDPWAILRAAWVNLTAGQVVQGGSTLTQQLVRNIFLDRSRTLARKLNEAALAILIEARFSKQQILEAYLNEVYLGQQGGQSVHGVAAATEFYFGHDLKSLSIPETALLIGMIQGPSYYDPRRYAERAHMRRNVVLGVMHEVGLINKTDRSVATAAALSVTPAGALPRNRYPAFLELVREQLKRDFPDSVLRTDGLTVLTTLAPATQEYAEAAVIERLKAIGKAGENLQAALVVTATDTGAVEAIVGGRDPDEPGFNRAIAARRPIGSLVKPFVYLVALAQPQAWSLMSTLSDRALSLRLPNGTVWSPANVDKLEHGDVALIDALARSYNLATVRLGLELDVRKVVAVLEALIPGVSITPNPSVLLGAIELSPLQVAQAYQYLAADGRPLALYALDGVIDAQGRSLSRHTQQPAPGDLVAASRLIGYALQETARSGTAHALVGLGLGRLQAAGKTGTSNDQRDSWFAGYTGSHLAVVWLGADDNRQTGLFGSTGAMRVWAALFAKLASDPLRLDLSDNPQLAWVDAQTQRLTDVDCPGARQLPFIRGYEPADFEGCGWARFSEWADGDTGSDSDDEEELEADSAQDQPRERPRSRWRDWFRRKRRDDDRSQDDTP